MVTTIQEVDLNAVVVRFAPIHWTAPDIQIYYKKSPNFGNTLDDIEIRNAQFVPPEQDWIDEYNDYLAEQATLQTQHTALDTQITTSAGVFTVQQYTLFLSLLNAVLPAFMGNPPFPTVANVYSAFVTQLNGTSVENALKGWVTMKTALTNFNPATATDSEKRQIMSAALEFIYGGMISTLSIKVKNILKGA